ncbi:amino acid adenylation domain-containing protein [Lentzea sp. BCCO 10_0061]|uniref:Amino acid adenylation domain-containing protein n=1 Tax=Lentzea sokolovensis TaxID=3095429 RepID=A0ABU4V822_9PSEU|nr:non-ribosomal peptide synthetase [Lentzea sp. BCCO 10_0061]MDX8147106.1 amino acid adenylation domain-containing protein [Lentzea sp. BCCO 10_0061]
MSAPANAITALSGAAIRLPIALPRPLTPTYRRRVVDGPSPVGADGFVHLLASLAMVVARHNDVDEVVVGCVHLDGDSPVVVPLRVTVDRAGSVDDALTSARRAVSAEHDSTTSGQAIPLLVVATGTRNLGQAVVEAHHLARLRSAVADADLVVSADTAKGKVRLDANADLFGDETTRDLLAQVTAAAIVCTTALGTRVGDVDLIGPDERSRLDEFSGATDVLEPATLHETVAQRAALTPNAVAVVCRGRSLTYRELDQRSNALAHTLTGLGAVHRARVGVRLERSVDLIVALLGVLKSGAAYVPIDPLTPHARQRQITELAGLSVVVTEPEMPPLGVDEVVVDDSVTGTPPPVDRTPDDPAYVMFTSGSTGRPKGVVVTHANVFRLLASSHRLFGFSADDVWLNAHTFAFDVSVWEIFGALVHGARLVIPSWDVTRDPDRLVRLVRDEKVTLVTTTPTAFQGFDESARALADPLPFLRYVVFCGEALTPASLEPWFRARGDQQPQLINMYGITETTVHSTFYRIRSEDVHDGRRKVGRGLSDTPIRVLDADRRLVPIGAVGEIHVGGAGVTAGYLIADEADHARFGPDPYSDLPGARLYRSGDLGRWLADGTLEYLGRNDHQVKIRGYRVELGELDHVLQQHPTVRSARSWIVRRPGLPPLLAAAVVPADGEDALTGLRDFVADRLPAYMVPAVLTSVDELPLTANGKLDTGRLPDPFAVPATGVVRPEDDPRAAEIAEAMADALALSSVDVDRSFFELGGDSITAIRLVAALYERGFAFELAQVYQARTARALAAESVTGALPTAPGVLPRALVPERDRRWIPAGAVDAFPATRLQAAMLFHSVLDGEHVYHDVFSYVVDGALDEPSVRRAVAELVLDHPVLRSAFVVDGPVAPIQVVHPSADVRCEFVELPAAGDVAPAVDEWASAERSSPFPWEEPGHLRVAVHTAPDGPSTLSLSFHHAILDGWSVASLVTDLLLRATTGRAPHTTERIARDTGLLSAYAAVEHATEEDPRQRSFWLGRIGERRSTTIPGRGREDVALAAGDDGEVTVVIPGEVTSALVDLARKCGVPLKSVHLAAHVALMSFVSGRPDVLTGLIAGGRAEVDGGDQVSGLFLNTVPFDIDVADDGWADLVRRVFDEETAIYPYRRFPYPALQSALGVERLCATAFNYTDFHVYADLVAEGVTVRGVRYREKTDFPFLLSVSEDPFDARTAVTISYDQALVGAAQARRYADHYVELLRHAGSMPGESPVRMLADRFGGRVGPAQDLPSPSITAFDLVLEAVAATPEGIAQCHDRVEHTYQDLAAQVGGVASTLREFGVGTGDRVACYVARGLDPLVALLGTWAVGASYVPMDSSLPPARQADQLALVRCAAVIRSAGMSTEDCQPPVPVHVLAGDAPRASAPGDWARPGPEDEAYVLFTSGSTGVPKAVGMPHRAMANLISWQIAQPEFASRPRVGQFAALSFDVSIQEMLSATASGGTLVVVPESARRNPQELLDFLDAEEIQVAMLPVVALHQLAAAHSAFRTAPRALRHVITAGEALVVTPAVRDFCASTGIELVNQYGPTETHVVTCHRLGPDPLLWSERPPIGAPVWRTRLDVRDPLGRSVPPGTEGELYVGGANVALGYVAAGVTEPAQQFTGPDVDGVRWYRTGDLVRLGDNGLLEFVGRTDDQVKIRGHRVEPQEVTTALLRIPGVRAAAVRMVEMTDSRSELVAFVEADAGTTADELLVVLRSGLPSYAVPAHVELIDCLPTTPSGKIDGMALPRPGASAPQPVDVVADGTEAEVLRVWEQLLGHPVRSPSVSFFDAGGSSLLLLPLYLQLRSQFGVDFSMHHLFQHPTARGFAEFIEGTGVAHTDGSAPRTRPARVTRSAARRRAARKSEGNAHD